MAMSPEMAYGASSGYTDQTVIGMGALKGAACKIGDVEDTPGGDHIITFLWEDNEGGRHSTQVTVRDGRPGENGSDGMPGAIGPQGENGFSPIIEVAESTSTVYRLRITTEDGAFTTPNLKGGSGGGGGTTGSYEDLDDKPRINGVELSGNKSSGDLNITAGEYTVAGETLYIR